MPAGSMSPTAGRLWLTFALQLSQNAQWDDVPVEQHGNVLPVEGEISDPSSQLRENSR